MKSIPITIVPSQVLRGQRWPAIQQLFIDHWMCLRSCGCNHEWDRQNHCHKTVVFPPCPFGNGQTSHSLLFLLSVDTQVFPYNLDHLFPPLGCLLRHFSLVHVWLYSYLGFTGGSDDNELACNVGDLGLITGLGKSPGGGHGNPHQYSCLENPHGQRNLVGYSLWGCKKLDRTKQLSTAHRHT